MYNLIYIFVFGFIFQSLLLLALVALVVNLAHLVILEVGEWRGFLSEADRRIIKEGEGLEEMMRKGEAVSHKNKFLF